MGEFAGGPGELTEYKRAVAINSSCNIFLADKVHSIAQRRDQHDVRRLIQRNKFLDRQVVSDVVNCGSADLPEGAIGVANDEFDLIADSLVLVDVLSARGRNLNENGLVGIKPLLVEEFGERVKSDADALGVVEAIDAEQDRSRVAKVIAELLGSGSGLRCPSDRIEAINVDRHSECTNVGFASTTVSAGHLDDVTVRRPPEESLGNREEVPRPTSGLESDEVCAEDSEHNWAPPRQL